MRMLWTDNPQIGVSFLVWRSSWFIFLSVCCHDDIATSDGDAIRLQVEYMYWLFDIRPNVKRGRQKRHLCLWQQFSHEKFIRSEVHGILGSLSTLTIKFLPSQSAIITFTYQFCFHCVFFAAIGINDKRALTKCELYGYGYVVKLTLHSFCRLTKEERHRIRYALFADWSNREQWIAYVTVNNGINYILSHFIWHQK